MLGRCGSYLSERLSHLPEEVLGELDGLVHGEVQTAVADVLLNPARKLPTFVRSGVTLWTREAIVTYQLISGDTLMGYWNKPAVNMKQSNISMFFNGWITRHNYLDCVETSHTLSAKIMSP